MILPLVAHDLRRLLATLFNPDSRRRPFGPSSLSRVIVGSEEARLLTLASVRRSNCTCGFPACSFHESATTKGRGCKEGISATRLTNPNSQRRRCIGRVHHPEQRHRL